MQNEWEKESKEGMRLSHMFLIVLAIHMFVIGGAFAFQYWRGGSEENLSAAAEVSEKKESRKKVSSAKKEVAEIVEEGVEPAPAMAPTLSRETVKPRSTKLATPAVAQKPVVKKGVEIEKASVSQSAFYKVVKGDNLSKIAKLHKVSIANLVKWNQLKGDVIHLGQTLKVSEEKVFASAVTPTEVSLTPVAVARPAIQHETAAPVATMPVAQPLQPQTPSRATEITVNRNEVVREVPVAQKTSQRIESYVVAKGDTLFAIAKKFGTKPQLILEANQLKDANKIGVGMKLKVPIETEVSQTESPKRAIEASNVAMSGQ